MRVKQFVGLICSVIGMVVIGTTTFAGGNISDKTYYFRFNTPYNYTYTRDKMDTTSSYMRCYSTTRGGGDLIRLMYTRNRIIKELIVH